MQTSELYKLERTFYVLLSFFQRENLFFICKCHYVAIRMIEMNQSKLFNQLVINFKELFHGIIQKESVSFPN